MKDKINQNSTYQSEKDTGEIIFSKFFRLPSGRKIQFARVFGQEQFVRHVPAMVNLANQSLPDEYDEIQENFFTKESATTASGQIYDLRSQWLGLTFLVFDDHDNLVGFTLGNIYEDENKTGGYSRLTIIDKKYHREGLGSALVGLLNKAFINKGVQKFSGSTEINNTNMRRLVENISTHTLEEGNFLRYEADMDIMNKVSDYATSKVSYFSELLEDLNLENLKN